MVESKLKFRSMLTKSLREKKRGGAKRNEFKGLFCKENNLHIQNVLEPWTIKSTGQTHLEFLFLSLIIKPAYCGKVRAHDTFKAYKPNFNSQTELYMTCFICFFGFFFTFPTIFCSPIISSFSSSSCWSFQAHPGIHPNNISHPDLFWSWSHVTLNIVTDPGRIDSSCAG